MSATKRQACGRGFETCRESCSRADGNQLAQWTAYQTSILDLAMVAIWGLRVRVPYWLNFFLRESLRIDALRLIRSWLHQTRPRRDFRDAPETPEDLAGTAQGLSKGRARCLGALQRQPDISIAMRSSLIRARSYVSQWQKKKKKTQVLDLCGIRRSSLAYNCACSASRRRRTADYTSRCDSPPLKSRFNKTNSCELALASLRHHFNDA